MKEVLEKILLLASILLVVSSTNVFGKNSQGRPGSYWPGEYTVQCDNEVLRLSTPYYTVEHDLKKGGAISRITLTHGKADNLLVNPLKTSVQNAAGNIFDDYNNTKAITNHSTDGKTEIVTVECDLKDNNGNSSEVKTKTTYKYRWGYIKIHKAFYFPSEPVKIKNLNILSTAFDKSLSDFGYYEAIAEKEGVDFFWGDMKYNYGNTHSASEPALKTRYVPRYIALVNPGVEGLEWFVASDLTEWDTQCSGKIGDGLCRIDKSDDSSIAVSISPLHLPEQPVTAKSEYHFDYYIGLPLLEGHANELWLHGLFNRRRGKWVSEEEIKNWEQSGIISAHCHNDSGEPNDIYWRDGIYPPYSPEEMKKFDDTIEMCHRYGIKVTTYFSNKELHPDAEEYKKYGLIWSRQDSKNDIWLNRGHTNKKTIYGAQMCLESGWLDFLKFSIDRVLKNHDLDGVYYDWNFSQLCWNSHTHPNGTENKKSTVACHWDIDGLIELMEWTRERVGPDGVIMVHNSQRPMFVTENFANYIATTEWGHPKWTDRPATLQELPLEWSWVGARPRGTLSYQIIDSKKTPKRFHTVFALESFVSGVVPWVADSETIALSKKLKPLGDLKQYKFAHWRNKAVFLDNEDCACAIYSRSEDAYILLVNLGADAKEVNCIVYPDRLPYSLTEINKAEVLYSDRKISIDAENLIKNGVKIPIPGDDMILLHIEEK